MVGGPLAGVRVLDFTRVLAGPFCTMLLGDLGAEVIKIERPGAGDDTRQWRPPDVNGESCYFLCVNRNKKSMTLNLKNSQAVEIAKKLVAVSDVVVENFMPGTMETMGLGYESVAGSINAKLVYCSITGYGPTGPYAKRGGYDVIAAAIGGLLHITGEENGAPCKPGVALIDLLTGTFAYASILAALFARERNGRGERIECNLLSTQIASLINIGSNYLNAGVDAVRRGTAHESIVPYQAFKTADSYLMIGAANDKQFGELCGVLRLDASLRTSEKFRTNVDRVRNRRELVEVLSMTFAEKTTDEWLRVFEAAKVELPYGPINNIERVFADPQVVHNGLVQSLEHPKTGVVKVTSHPVTFTNATVEYKLPPPTLGEHTSAILAELLGVDEKRIEELRTSGAI